MPAVEAIMRDDPIFSNMHSITFQPTAVKSISLEEAIWNLGLSCFQMKNIILSNGTEVLHQHGATGFRGWTASFNWANTKNSVIWTDSISPGEIFFGGLNRSLEIRQSKIPIPKDRRTWMAIRNTREHMPLTNMHCKDSSLLLRVSKPLSRLSWGLDGTAF